MCCYPFGDMGAKSWCDTGGNTITREAFYGDGPLQGGKARDFVKHAAKYP